MMNRDHKDTSSNPIKAAKGVQVQIVMTDVSDGKQEIAKVIDASKRPRTLIGPQGDHVSAYALFQACVINKCKALSPEEAIKVVVYTIDQYTQKDEASTIIEQIGDQKEILGYMTDQEIEQTATYLGQSKAEQTFIDKVKGQLRAARSAAFERILSEIIAIHFTLRNKLELTSFPSEGNVPPRAGEGARIKSALRKLEKIAEQEKLRYKEIPPVINELFWYPEIPADTMLAPDSREWKEAAKKYNAGTLPRTNDLDMLCQAIENHLQLTFMCYPKFYEAAERIIPAFADIVMQEWKSLSKGKEAKKKQEAVRETVKMNLYLHYKLGEESRKGSRRAGESGGEDVNMGDDKKAATGGVGMEIDAHEGDEGDYYRRGSGSSAGSSDHSASGSDVDDYISPIPYHGQRITYDAVFSTLNKMSSLGKDTSAAKPPTLRLGM